MTGWMGCGLRAVGLIGCLGATACTVGSAPDPLAEYWRGDAGTRASDVAPVRDQQAPSDTATREAATDDGTGSAGDAGGPGGPPNRTDAGDEPPNGADAGERAADAGADGPAPNDGGKPDTRPDPADAWTAGDYPPDISAETYLELAGVPGQAGRTRQYKVHVPPSYDPDVPTPLVFCIHGLGQSPVLFCVNGAQMHMKSDAEGFLLVMPFGYLNSWNAGTCCGAASSEQLDDVALFRALLEKVGKHLNVDPDRVYATGLSNGGYMSYRLACDAAELFAAIAPAAGAIGINDIGGGTNPLSDFTTCQPSRPVPVLASHGTTDPLIPFSLQARTFDELTNAYGCRAESAPATQPESSGDTMCQTVAGCPNGIELTSCSVQNGGHCWFGSPDCGTGAGAIGLVFVGNNSTTLQWTDEVWDFFERSQP